VAASCRGGAFAGARHLAHRLHDGVARYPLLLGRVGDPVGSLRRVVDPLADQFERLVDENLALEAELNGLETFAKTSGK